MASTATIHLVDITTGLGLTLVSARTGQHGYEPSNTSSQTSASGTIPISWAGCSAAVTELRLVSQIRALLTRAVAGVPTANAVSQEITVRGHCPAGQFATGALPAGG